MWRNRDNVRTGKRRVLDVHDGANASNDDARRKRPVIKPLPDVLYGGYGVITFVCQASSEDAHVSGPRLRRQNGLVERQDRSGVHGDALLRQTMYYAQAGLAEFVDDGYFDDDVAGPGGE